MKCFGCPAHEAQPAMPDRMVELVEPMLKLHGDSSRLAAYSLRHEEHVRDSAGGSR